MPNPVGTKEQREELRHQHRLVNLYIPSEVKANLGLALDGLDIAQEMAWALRAQTELMDPEGVMPCCDDCEERERKIRDALAKWDKWQGG